MKRNRDKKIIKTDRRELISSLEGVDIEFRNRVRYFGSPYHKSRPTFFGFKPPKRVNASQTSICPDNLHDEATVQTVEEWMRIAVGLGAFRQIEERHSFPKYIWYMEGDIVYEATGGEWNGIYHGYPLSKNEWPAGIEKLNWNV